jgi:hypothetical protein
MLELARALLDKRSEYGDEWGRFLLLAGMLGGHSGGADDEADELWSKYGRALYPGGVIPPHVIYVVNLGESAGAASR